jgi:hypothetical protein
MAQLFIDLNNAVVDQYGFVLIMIRVLCPVEELTLCFEEHMVISKNLYEVLLFDKTSNVFIKGLLNYVWSLEDRGEIPVVEVDDWVIEIIP